MAGLQLTTPAGVPAQSGTATTRTLIGRITSKDGGLPLGNSTISIASLERERFSDANGRFEFDSLPRDAKLQVLVRHLGYYPATIALGVSAGQADSIEVSLTRVVLALPTVEIRADRACNKPGLPTVGEDSALAVVFDQLRQNFDQYRLLSRNYPFSLEFEILETTRNASGDPILTTENTSNQVNRGATWSYRAGGLIPAAGEVHRESVPNYFLRFWDAKGVAHGREVRIPTLVQFAEPAFLASHCFLFAGLEAIDSVPFLRVDLAVESRLKGTDVNGSLYLDPATYQIRRTVLHLTGIPEYVECGTSVFKCATNTTDVEITTDFQEIFPSIPLEARRQAVQRYKPSKDSSAAASRVEEYRLLRTKFLNSKPGDRP